LVQKDLLAARYFTAGEKKQKTKRVTLSPKK